MKVKALLTKDRLLKYLYPTTHVTPSHELYHKKRGTMPRKSETQAIVDMLKDGSKRQGSAGDGDSEGGSGSEDEGEGEGEGEGDLRHIQRGLFEYLLGNQCSAVQDGALKSFIAGVELTSDQSKLKGVAKFDDIRGSTALSELAMLVKGRDRDGSDQPKQTKAARQRERITKLEVTECMFGVSGCKCPVIFNITSNFNIVHNHL